MENEQIKQKMPVGMIFILILIGWGAVSLLLGVLKIPLSQLKSITISGAGALVVNLVGIGISGIIFYGILKRFRWARKLAIGWYVFSMVMILINTILFLADKTMYISYSQNTASLMAPAAIIGSLVFGWIIGFIIIIYLARKKDFFVN